MELHMLNFIPTSFSNKFTPGSPDCIVSTEQAVKLQLNIAFIKACIGSIFPIIFSGPHPAKSFDGNNLSYRGAFNRQTGSLIGRGVAYEGSLPFPRKLLMGFFEKNGKLKEGYIYENENGRIAHVGYWKESLIVNIVTPKGEYVRGVFPKETATFFPTSEVNHSFTSQASNKGLPIPVLGGEIFGTSHDGIVFKGTFQPNGTFTGSMSFPDGGPFMEGVFSIQMLSDGSGRFSSRQISGTCTYRRGERVNGSTLTLKISSEGDQCNGQFEGRETFSDGSFREGLFAYQDAPGGWFVHLSGPVEIKMEDGFFKGKMLDKNTLEGRETQSNGSFREGIFDFDLELGIKQLSGNFEQRYEDGSVYTGKILNEETFQGQMVFPNGSFKSGVFLRDLSLAKTGFFRDHISGTFKRIEADGQVIEGEILGNNNHWKGSQTFPNGSFRNGVFSIQEKDTGFIEINQLSGTFKMIHNDGTILEGVYDGEATGTATLTFPGEPSVKMPFKTEEGNLIFPRMHQSKRGSINGDNYLLGFLGVGLLGAYLLSKNR